MQKVKSIEDFHNKHRLLRLIPESASASCRKPSDEVVGKSVPAHQLLYRGDVIDGPSQKPETFIGIENSVGRPGVPSPGLPDASGIEERLPSLHVESISFPGDMGNYFSIKGLAEIEADVAVTEEADRSLEKGEIPGRVGRVKDVVADKTCQSTVKEADSVKQDKRFQSAQELTRPGVQPRAGPFQSRPRMFVEVLQRKSSQNRPVVVAGNRGYREFGQPIDTLVRLGPVADYVAEAEDLIPLVRRIGENSFEGKIIRVQIRDYQVPHCVYYEQEEE
jgi:hypothetical protein